VIIDSILSMNASEIIEGLGPHERRLLIALDELGGKASVEEVFEAGGFTQLVEVMNAASWLQSKGLIDMLESARKVFSLKDREVSRVELPERRVLRLLEQNEGRTEMAELSGVLDKEEISIAIGWLRRKGLANLEKIDGRKMLLLTDRGKEMIHSQMEDERLLEILSRRDLSEEEVDGSVMADLLSRQNMVSERLVISRSLELTEMGKEVLAMGLEVTDEVAQLTPELLQTGRWREVSFRKYDIRTFAPSVYPGKKHPLSRIADEVRDIFVQMGFEEIDEEYAQPAFWNMDALFIPQDHPARDLQDTFYLSNPYEIELEDKGILEIIRQVHENGWKTGSTGWGYKWDEGLAKRALLRTHTTVNTIRYLWKHPEPPVKVFSLSRVFRNEAIDATHLPEFMQIEGILMEKGTSLDMLIGVLKEFYRMMGFEDIRVRPGYFPYTEPSLEVEVLHNGSWMELGGAGIFRPEVTLPFGVEYPVLAWGLGFERLAMLKWNLNDLRDLYISDIDMLRRSSIL
jgi:phenylalanyl-tRNA synthetase alpha chain